MNSKQFHDRLRAEIHQRERTRLRAGQMRFQVQAEAPINRGDHFGRFHRALDRVSPDVVAFADQDRLQQVLINLVDNAIKYSAADQPVDLVLEQTEHQVMIHVRDRGIGISLPHQNRIFERFYRVDEARTREQGGTGLGLAIVKHIVQLHGGTVAVTSEPGNGSVLSFTLKKA